MDSMTSIQCKWLILWRWYMSCKNRGVVWAWGELLWRSCPLCKVLGLGIKNRHQSRRGGFSPNRLGWTLLFIRRLPFQRIHPFLTFSLLSFSCRSSKLVLVSSRWICRVSHYHNTFVKLKRTKKGLNRLPVNHENCAPWPDVCLPLFVLAARIGGHRTFNVMVLRSLFSLIE